MAIVHDAIGSFSFLRLEGPTPQPQAVELADVTRPAVDGVAKKVLGTRGEEFEQIGEIDALNSTAAATLVSLYKAAVGTIVNIVYAGETYVGYLVLGMTVEGIRVVKTPAGGINGGTHLVRSRWRLVYGGT